MKFKLSLYDDDVKIPNDSFEIEHKGPLDVTVKSMNIALDEAVGKAKDLFRGLT